MAVQGKFSSLSYTGVNATNPPNFWLFQRAPTPNDCANYIIGDIWEYQVIIPGNPPNYAQSRIYHLVAQYQGMATWVEATSSGLFTTINYQYFTTPGTFTYTPTQGMVQCVVECVGAGGGSASVAGSGAGVFQVSPGGGGGGYCKKLFTASQIGGGQSLTVGATGGITSSGNTGSTGGNTTFGTFLTAHGGQGPTINVSPGVGGTATGGDINIQGGTAQGAVRYPLTGAWSGWASAGGSVAGGWGIGGALSYANPSPENTDRQSPGVGYGAGAGGLCYSQVLGGGTTAGLGGQGGLVVITEYIN